MNKVPINIEITYNGDGLGDWMEIRTYRVDEMYGKWDVDEIYNGPSKVSPGDLQSLLQHVAWLNEKVGSVELITVKEF